MRSVSGELQSDLTADSMSKVMKAHAEISDLQWRISLKMQEMEDVYRTEASKATSLIPGDYLLCWKDGSDRKETDKRVLYRFREHTSESYADPGISLLVSRVSIQKGTTSSRKIPIHPDRVDIIFPGAMYWHTVKTLISTYRLMR